jgi:signal transduction histidine kinase/DNA-binding response OmpR family regulator
MVIVTCACAAGVPTDFLVLDGYLLGAIFTSDVLYFIGSIIALFLLRRAKWPQQQDRAFNLWLIVMAVVLTIGILSRIPSGIFQGPIIASGTFLSVLYFAQRGPVFPRAVAGCVVTIGCVLLILLGNHKTPIEPPLRLTSIIAIVAVNLIGIFSARSFDQQRRFRYEAERQERQLRRALAIEKRRAEAMAHTRGVFLASMSHEFRTPMNAVIGLSDVLLDAPLINEHWRHVRTINDSARALLGLLNDVLDFAKIDAQKIELSTEHFELRELVTSVVEMLTPQATAQSLELRIDVSPDVPEYLVGDDARFRQVLVNLVSNAIKFTDKGSVRLHIMARPLDGAAWEITCRVEDTGIGMAPDVMARLFEPFEQAHQGHTQGRGGTGLGLAISKRIAVAMGGDISVESAVGRGSVFTFKLRIEAIKAPAPTVEVKHNEDRPALAILVVDDNAINRDVAFLKLGRLGYRVDLANDGQSAIDAVLKKAYDVVFMDIRMPGMTGIEATQRIVDLFTNKRAPFIVAMTASVFEEDREACRQAGMRDFVGKPIDLEQIDAVLRRAAEERGGLTHNKSTGTIRTKESATRIREINALGDPQFFANLCRLFLTEAEKRVPRMVKALEQGDLQSLEDDAHLLTSASAALGVIDMSEMCRRIERAARHGNIEEIQCNLNSLWVEYRSVEHLLLQEIQRALRITTSGFGTKDAQHRTEKPSIREEAQ